MMQWLRKLLGRKPEPEIAWHKERLQGHWDSEAWCWRGEPYLLVSCYADRAHAEESATWDRVSIDCVSSRVTGPHPHRPGTCREHQ